MPDNTWKRRRQANKKGYRPKNAPPVSGSMVLNFGKFRGTRLGEVPADYLLWLAANHADSNHPQVQDVLWWINRHPKAIVSRLYQ